MKQQTFDEMVRALSESTGAPASACRESLRDFDLGKAEARAAALAEAWGAPVDVVREVLGDTVLAFDVPKPEPPKTPVRPARESKTAPLADRLPRPDKANVGLVELREDGPAGNRGCIVRKRGGR